MSNDVAQILSVPTFGEILPDSFIEAVWGPRKSNTLQLHVHKGSRFSTSAQIHHGQQIYVAHKLSPGLSQAVRFPAPSAQFGSAAKLTESMAEFICNFGKMTREDANLLAAFALATWFVDCFRLAPILHLTGSAARVHLIMRLLSCICRRPILLGRLDTSVLSTLPERLEATLLIYEERLVLSWLQANGCPVDISTVESSITIQQQNRDDVSQLFDLPDGRTGCILDLTINNEGPGPQITQYVELTMPWSDCGFQLLQDPRERVGRYPNLYCFPGPSLEYPRKRVLNHFLFPDCILQPNSPKSGLLLGVGNPMSREIRHGAVFTGVISIITDRGTAGVCEIRLWTDRMSIPRAKLNKRSPGYKGLFERESGTEDASAEYSRKGDVALRASRSTHEGRDGHIRADKNKNVGAEREQ